MPCRSRASRAAAAAAAAGPTRALRGLRRAFRARRCLSMWPLLVRSGIAHLRHPATRLEEEVLDVGAERAENADAHDGDQGQQQRVLQEHLALFATGAPGETGES